jgi:hypothetical protein
MADTQNVVRELHETVSTSNFNNIFTEYYSHKTIYTNWNKTTLLRLVHKWTMPTKQLPLIDEGSANCCGKHS